MFLLILTIASIPVLLGITKARRRMYHAQTQRARRQAALGLSTSTFKAPSWFNQNVKVSLFQNAILENAIGEGVPPGYIGMLLAQPESLPMMLSIAASFEESGRLFTEQILAVVDWIIGMWKDISLDKQQVFRTLGDCTNPVDFKAIYKHNISKKNRKHFLK